MHASTYGFTDGVREFLYFILLFYLIDLLLLLLMYVLLFVCIDGIIECLYGTSLVVLVFDDDVCSVRCAVSFVC